MNISAALPSPDGAGASVTSDRWVVPKQLGIFREAGPPHPLTLASIVQRIIENRNRYEVGARRVTLRVTV